MALGGYEAGSVYVRLGGRLDHHDFDAYDRAVERAQRKKAVETTLGGKVDKHAFEAYDRALGESHASAKRRSAFKAALGGDYDPKAFRAYERALAGSQQRSRHGIRAKLEGIFVPAAFRRYDSAVKTSGEHTGRLEKRFGKLKDAAILAGGVTGLGGLTLGIESVAKAGLEMESSEAKVRKAVENAGISWEKYGERINGALTKQAELTGFQKQDLEDAFANMIRTTGSVNEALHLNGVAADIARTKGMKLQGAQSLLARVYNGSYTGLKRLGIAITPVTTAQDKLRASSAKATPEQLKQAKAHDQLATRTEALRIVQQKFAGQAGAYSKTTQGAFDRARASLEIVQQRIGAAILPGLAKAGKGIADFAIQMDEGKGAGGRFANTLKTIWAAIKPVILTLGQAALAVGAFVAHHPALLKVAGGIIAVGLALKALRFTSALLGIDKVVIGLKKIATSRAGDAAARAIGGGLERLPGFSKGPLGKFTSWLKRRGVEAGAEAGAAEAGAHSSAGAGSGLVGKFKGKWGRFKSWLIGSSATAGAEAGVAEGGAMAGSSGLLSGKVLSRFGVAGKALGGTIAVALRLAVVAGLALVGLEITKWIKKQDWYKPPGGKGSFWDSLIPTTVGPGPPRKNGGPAKKTGKKGGKDIWDHVVDVLTWSPFQTGGPIGDPQRWGGGDIVPSMLEHGEHVWTKEEVQAAGGHGVMERMRRTVRGRRSEAPALSALGATWDSKSADRVRSGWDKVHSETKTRTKAYADTVKRDFKDAGDGAEKSTKDLHQRVGKQLDELSDDGGKKLKGFAKTVGDRLDDARDAAKKKAQGAKKAVLDRFDELNSDGSRKLKRLVGTINTRLEEARKTASSKGRQFAGGIGGGMDSADAATFTGLGYIARATASALKALGAKAPAFDVPSPSHHATGGVPHPGSGARDDHVLVDPLGRPVALMSGTEGIVNDPQMAEINRWGAIAHALGFSPFRGLGDLWRSGMRHLAGGGGLGGVVTRANALDKMHLPYVWGGHHGDRGPIRDPRPGLDCSSAVSYVLGIPPRVSSGFMNYGKPGRGPVSILSNPDHAYMVINGRAFSTSRENPGSGAGWVDSYVWRSGFSERHVDAAPGDADVPRARVRGPAGRLRAIAQGALDSARRGGRRRIGAAITSMDNTNGQPLREGAGNYLATAYGPPWGGIQGGGVTATGVDLRRAPHEQIIAVDPQRISLHSNVKVWPNPFGTRSTFHAEDTGGAIKGNRIDIYDWRGRGAQNRWGKRLVNVTGAMRGGLLRRFATGGALNPIVDRAKAKVAGLKHRVSGYPKQIERLEGQYTRTEKQFTLAGIGASADPATAFVIPASASSPARLNMRAIDERARELGKLAALRQRIIALYRKEAEAMRQELGVLAEAIKRVRAALQRAKPKQRPNYEKALAALQRSYSDTRDSRDGLLDTLLDQRIDLKGLTDEYRGLQPGAAKALADLAPTDATGGADTTGTDTSADLAGQLAQAQQQLVALAQTVKAQDAGLATFRGPGDIGTGLAPSAYQGGFPDLGGVGAGNPYGGGRLASAAAGQASLGDLPDGKYILQVTRIDDPQGQRDVGKAAVGGINLGGYVPAPRERTGL